MLFTGAARERLLDALEAATHADRALTPALIARVARETGVPEAEVYGVATFYHLLARPDAGHRVCQGPSCQAAGSAALLAELQALGHKVEAASCLGQCDRAPAALDPELELVGVPADTPGTVLPPDPSLPIDLGGPDLADYSALGAAVAMGPEATLRAIEQSGLQGRGGAGFPAHIKWRAVAGAADPERYLVCNADEGEPGTFKDREVMLRRPHRLLEGLLIAAHTVGAREIYIYVRGEFRGPRRALERALTELQDPATRALGRPPPPVRLVNGHGAYICGEETALIEALEGRRGMPRIKPPFPTVHGFRGKPTLMNNVETLACVPDIIARGGPRFRAAGRTEAGTKLYCVSGHVERPGTYELPLGVTLDELVAAAGGYVGTPLAFSPGGASSGFLPMTRRALPLDFASLAGVGSMLGSAGVVVFNDTVDLAVATRWQLQFFEDETCGQCAPCRIGTRMLRQAVDRYLEAGDPATLDHVDDVAWEMEQGSICGLGIAAPLPLTSALTHFADHFQPRP